jgi:hypothetical protein
VSQHERSDGTPCPRVAALGSKAAIRSCGRECPLQRAGCPKLTVSFRPVPSIRQPGLNAHHGSNPAVRASPPVSDKILYCTKCPSPHRVGELLAVALLDHPDQPPIGSRAHPLEQGRRGMSARCCHAPLVVNFGPLPHPRPPQQLLHRPPFRHRLGRVQPVPVGPVADALRPAAVCTVEAADGPYRDCRRLTRQARTLRRGGAASGPVKSRAPSPDTGGSSLAASAIRRERVGSAFRGAAHSWRSVPHDDWHSPTGTCADRTGWGAW